MRDALHSMFHERGLLPGPGVIEYILTQDDPAGFIQRALTKMSIKKDHFIVNLSDLKEISGEISVWISEEKKSASANESGSQPVVKVVRDYASSCMSCGDADSFLRYFRSRLNKMRRFLPQSNIRISSIRDGMDVCITGMISEIGDGKKAGSKLVELEDETGSITVYINSEHQKIGRDLLLDEIIHIRGKASVKREMKRYKPIIFAEAVIRPECTLRHSRSKPSGTSVVAFISDLHVGSKTFLSDAWNRFIRWINGPDMLAKRVKTIVVCGDNVDGIGVYPDQEKDLLIVDIEEQYKACVEILQGIREDITVVVIPGNHDAIRPGEPQPALTEEIKSMFKDKRFIFSGNPSLVQVEGCLILAYHGRSIDDMISCIHGLSYSEPEKAMIEMLRRRHLVSVYGKNTPIYPSNEDCLIIDEVPHIFVTGHVHTSRVSEYHGITLINASAWQSQTEYQKMRNFFPSPARVILYDLAEGQVRVRDFSE